MRAILLVTLVGLAAVGAASSSYVAYSNVTAGRANFCEAVTDSEEPADFTSMFSRARLKKH